MKKIVHEIIVREEKLHGILFLPDQTTKSKLKDDSEEASKDSEVFPLVIHINGMPGTSPEEDQERFGQCFTQNGIALYCFDHLGVRQSSGVFTYFAAQANIEYVIDNLVQHPQIDPLKIGLLGESFGGAMALCHTARDNRISAIGVRSPVFDTEIIPTYGFFDDLLKIWTRNKQMRFPSGNDLKNIYITQTRHYNPKNMIKRITQPFYLVAGKKDELLGYQGFENLFKEIRSSVKFFDLHPKANHNFSDKSDFEKMRNTFVKFFNNVLFKER
ncbi:MAG: alpha/beta hydrolase [Promethearchaeota archaeon]